MTCVVALKRKDHFVLISDSCASGATYKYIVTNENLSKNNRYFEDHNCLMAHTGTCSYNQTVASIPKLFSNFNEKYTKFDIEYVRHVVKPMIINRFNEYGILTNTDAQDTAVNLFLVNKDKCIELRSDGNLREIDEIAVFGSGQSACLGAFLNCDPNLDDFIKSLKGLKAACKHNEKCDFPLIITSSKDGSRYILNEEEVDALIKGEKELDI